MSASMVRPNLQLVRVQLVTVPFDGSAGSVLAVLFCNASFGAGGTACLHGELDQENDLDSFFFSASLFLSLKLCNYSIT